MLVAKEYGVISEIKNPSYDAYRPLLTSDVPVVQVTGRSIHHRLAIKFCVPFAVPTVGYAIRVEAGLRSPTSCGC